MSLFVVAANEERELNNHLMGIELIGTHQAVEIIEFDGAWSVVPNLEDVMYHIVVRLNFPVSSVDGRRGEKISLRTSQVDRSASRKWAARSRARLVARQNVGLLETAEDHQIQIWAHHEQVGAGPSSVESQIFYEHVVLPHLIAFQNSVKATKFSEIGLHSRAGYLGIYDSNNGDMKLRKQTEMVRYLCENILNLMRDPKYTSWFEFSGIFQRHQAYSNYQGVASRIRREVRKALSEIG